MLLRKSAIKWYYDSTLPNKCCRTTLQNWIHRNCIFLLKFCMFLCQQTHKTHWNYHLLSVEPTFFHRMIDYMQQIGPGRVHSMQPSVAQTAFTKSVILFVTVSKIRNFSLMSLIACFYVLPFGGEALIGWGRKVNWLLIAEFVVNISAEN